MGAPGTEASTEASTDAGTEPSTENAGSVRGTDDGTPPRGRWWITRRVTVVPIPVPEVPVFSMHPAISAALMDERRRDLLRAVARRPARRPAERPARQDGRAPRRSSLQLYRREPRRSAGTVTE